MYVINFRIPFRDPFGNTAYFNQAAVSPKPLNNGYTVYVRDTRTGFLSPYAAEVYGRSLTSRTEESFRFRIEEM